MKKIYACSLFMLLITCTSFAQRHAKIGANYKTIVNQLDKEANKSYSVKTVGILVYEDFADLDAIGIQADLSSVTGTDVFLIAPERGAVKSGAGNTYMVDTSIDDVDHLDILIVPGGLQTTYMLTKNQKVLDWIRKIDSTSTFTSSVCTGAWVLGAAGLLKGKNATTHWYRGAEMLKEYGATYEPKRYVRDGKYWTAAGVSAGIDMGLAMVLATRGKLYTQIVMLNLQYEPQPPVNNGGSPQKADPKVLQMMTEMYDMGLKEVKKDGTK